MILSLIITRLLLFLIVMKLKLKFIVILWALTLGKGLRTSLLCLVLMEYLMEYFMEYS
jgi:hypothetical protein